MSVGIAIAVLLHGADTVAVQPCRFLEVTAVVVRCQGPFLQETHFLVDSLQALLASLSSLEHLQQQAVVSLLLSMG